MELHEKLKNARQNSGYSQETVARKLNISRQAVSRWETGKAYPDLHSLTILSKLYGVTLDELATDLPDTETPQSKETNTTLSRDPEVIAEIQKMKSDFRKLIITATAVLSCLIPIPGIFVTIGTFVYCVCKKEKLHWILWGILCICIIINMFNTFVALNQWFFKIGHSSVKTIAALFI